MFSLFKKEILQFFGSLTGYVVIAVFLIVTALFLWVFEGNYNIPDGGYATLGGLFDLAPWIYLFLIPAITMRMFSEETRGGTMELLLTRPISELNLVLAKFLASLVVVLLTLIPTLLYFLSVYFLGSPVGSIDVGATWASYVGLFLLALIYLAIGIFASSVTENQIVAFLIAVFLSFFWFSGFDFIAELLTFTGLSSFFTSLGINSHYESVSRGVLDSRDLFYFLCMAGFFVLLTRIMIMRKRRSVKRASLSFMAYCFALLILASLVDRQFFRIDFTQERRYTLSDLSIDLMGKAEAPIAAEVYLSGDLPSGFRKLQIAITDKLNDFKRYSSKQIFIEIKDPYNEVKAEKRTAYFESLMQRGVMPTDLRIKTDEGTTTKWIFPSVILRSGDEEVAVNLLKYDPSLPDEVNLNRSVEMLEYEFARAFKVLFQKKKEKVAFLDGHQELDQWQVKDFTTTLSENFDVSFLDINEFEHQADSIKSLVIARPENRFSEKDKFVIDQYLMKGGNIMWLIDPVQVSLDSLSEGMTTLAFPSDLNLTDQLFHYGIRLGNTLLQDVDCVRIKITTALAGQSPKYSLAPWYFSPLLQPVQNHPVGRNVNRVMSEFVSSIELVGEKKDEIRSSVLLTTSPYARINEAPMIVSLSMTDAPPAKELFNKSDIPVGVLVEGKFTSVFRNRMVEGLGLPAGTSVIGEGKPARMMVFADGGLIANKVNRSSQGNKILPLGFDRVSNLTYGNKEFFVNAIHYLCDDSGIMELRSRIMQIRLLDKVKLRDQKIYWQLLNVVVPVLLVIMGGLIFAFYRKRHSRLEYDNPVD